ncbi:hypothetical protein D3C80_448550 [compost metagenome]
MNSTSIAQLVDRIREWELHAGESFCDYFLDNFSYNGAWNAFLLSKGYKDLVAAIEADVYVSRDGERFPCTDQELKFEPHSSALYESVGCWDEEVYRQDVALWAEFILSDQGLFEECELFFKEG